MGQIFISYSHKNKKLVDEILDDTFAGYEDYLWVDDKIKDGIEWKKSIEEAIDSSIGIIFFVTQDFLDSDFIINNEIPYIVNRRKELAIRGHEDAITLKLIRLDNCNWNQIPIVNSLQVVNPVIPLEESTIAEKKEFLIRVRNELVEQANNPLKGIDQRLRQERQLWNPASGHCELEMRFQHLSFTEYTVELIYSYLHINNKENYSKFFNFSIKLSELVAHELNTYEYGQLLLEKIFISSGVSDYLEKEILAQYVNIEEIPLSIRICIYPNAFELHAVNWELLNRRNTYKSPFSSISHIIISRYLIGNYPKGMNSKERIWHDAELKAQKDKTPFLLIDFSRTNADELKDTCTAICAQSKCDKLKFDCAKAELAFEKITGEDNFLEETELPELSIEEKKKQADIVFFVFPGKVVNHKLMVLPDGREIGKANEIAYYIERIVKRYGPPRVLIACPIWGANDKGKNHQPFIPSLTQYGIPGIVFLPHGCNNYNRPLFFEKFFSMLFENGRLDYSLGHARAVLAEKGETLCGDYLLLTRKRTSRIWYKPHFLQENENTWEDVKKNIKEGSTPIIGPSFCDYIYQSRKALAAELATEYFYPLALHERYSLTHVMQYIFLNDDINVNIHELFLKKILTYYHKKIVSPALSQQEIDKLPYGDACKEIHKLFETLPAGPNTWKNFHLIAKEKFKFNYIVTTAFHNFLTMAFEKGHRQAMTASFVVKNSEKPETKKNEKCIDRDQKDSDNPKPLIYHLFGQMKNKGEMLLTEDDMFDFLLTFKEKTKKKVLKHITARLIDSNLIFLGFKMEQWDFRFIMRALRAMDGATHMKEYNHIAVQIDPDDDYITDPGNAKKFIEQYFNEINSNKVNIFWGSTEDFLKELDRRVEETE